MVNKLLVIQTTSNNARKAHSANKHPDQTKDKHSFVCSLSFNFVFHQPEKMVSVPVT